MCQDSIGGEYVENPNYSMVLVEATKKTILAELSSDVTLLQSGPEGLFKRLEIGVNNYAPQEFLNQNFQIYFFDDSNKQEEKEEPLLISQNQKNSFRNAFI